MNLEKIVLELMGRIQECEEKVQQYKQRLEKAEEEIEKLKSNENEEEIDEDNITRSQVRNKAIDEIKLRLKLKEEQIKVGNREEGGGIVICNKNDKKCYKFYYSKTYGGDSNSDKVISWSGILEKDINNSIDGYIFTIIKEQQMYILIFTNKQLVKLINDTNKQVDSKKKYHFSFEIENGTVFETRGDKHINVSYSLNNFASMK